MNKHDLHVWLNDFEVVWYSHTSKVSTFPKLPEVFRYLGMGQSRMQDQLDRIEANQKKIMDALGVE